MIQLIQIFNVTQINISTHMDDFFTCAFTVQTHLIGRITSAPLLSQAAEPLQDSYTGLTAPAAASDPTISMTIRVRVLHSGAHPAHQCVEPQACMAVRDVLSVGFSAYCCSAPCISLQTPPTPPRGAALAPRRSQY